MDSFKKSLYAFVVVLVVWFGLVASKPTDFVPDRVDLNKVINQTTCPVEVEFDFDEKRIPQRIKVLKCKEEPLQWCRQMGVPEQECCHRRRAGAWMGCAQVMDTVEVYWPAQGLTQQHRVPVGCACVIEQVARAGELTPADFQK